jgi:hypothetical protein
MSTLSRNCWNRLQRPRWGGFDRPCRPGSRGRDPGELRPSRLHWHIDPRHGQGHVRLRERGPWMETHDKCMGVYVPFEIPAKIAAFQGWASGRNVFSACRLEARTGIYPPTFCSNRFHPP